MDVETGVAPTGYNDVKVPGTNGTFFSLKDDLNARTDLFYRIRAGYIINDRHTISLLFAPLTIESKGINAFDIYFQDQTFSRGTAHYRNV